MSDQQQKITLRAAAIRARGVLFTALTDYQSTHNLGAVHVIQRRIEELNEALDNCPGWTSVATQFPAHQAPVIAYSPSGTVIAAYYGELVGWMEVTEYNNVYGVSHWMPLPEPPV